jgi:anti-sigma regulatory factor (Ser/Thr protein kinase)
MPKMTTNVIGKVSNISLTYDNGLMALHEAIVNSLQSIEAAQRTNRDLKGRILIEVRRDPTAESTEDGLLPVRDVVIEDNGVGFNPRNYLSFQTAESTYKLKIGGKGIGRFLWLKVFDHVEVRSCYKDLKDQKLYNRSFAFVLNNKNPIVDEHLVPAVNGEARPLGARIKLCGLQPDYAESFVGPLGELADAIIEHHIHYLVDDSCPEIIVREVRTDKESLEINLNTRRLYVRFSFSQSPERWR